MNYYHDDISPRCIDVLYTGFFQIISKRLFIANLITSMQTQCKIVSNVRFRHVKSSVLLWAHNKCYFFMTMAKNRWGDFYRCADQIVIPHLF